MRSKGDPPTPRTRALSGAIDVLERFFALEAAGGIVLVLATALALALANSPLAGVYQDAVRFPVGLSAGPVELHKPVVAWVNDGLMALFFLVASLELKRELTVGHLSAPRSRSLPGAAAFGGMVIPALIYATLNRADPAALRGWAIPAATDIAFALGVLALVGPRAPAAVKALLLSIAILDDLGAIVVIALFYSARLEPAALVLALVILGLLYLLNRRGIRALGPYLALGAALWVAVFASGLHATLAGVLLAAFVPGKGAEHGSSRSPLERLEEGLHSWVAFGVIPLFAFANAGVSLSGVTLPSLLQPVPLGIAAGLVVGKLVGILGGCWLVLGGNWKGLPPGITPRVLLGVAALCGIGFTMSLFVASLAFEPDDVAAADLARIGILAGSFVAALLGFFLLRGSTAAGPKAPVQSGSAFP